MIEPTESESKAELDRLCDSLICKSAYNITKHNGRENITYKVYARFFRLYEVVVCSPVVICLR